MILSTALRRHASHVGETFEVIDQSRIKPLDEFDTRWLVASKFPSKYFIMGERRFTQSEIISSGVKRRKVQSFCDGRASPKVR
jgi:hypothetical protein